MTGALLGVLALFSGFLAEMVVMGAVAPIYACWRVSVYSGASIVGPLKRKDTIQLTSL